MHIYIYIYMYICIYTCICVCVYIYIYIYTCVYIYVCVCVCVCVCVYVYKYIHTCYTTYRIACYYARVLEPQLKTTRDGQAREPGVSGGDKDGGGGGVGVLARHSISARKPTTRPKSRCVRGVPTSKDIPVLVAVPKAQIPVLLY
jgi:hypothetical protein